MNRKKAVLELSDGTQYHGYAFGYAAEANGEVVFNTGMTGYPETLTDPSYRGQILVMTYPLIGNYGIPDRTTENGILKNFESDAVQIQGLIVEDYSEAYSHYEAVESLEAWMIRERIPGITGIDTRMVTRKLRGFGTTPGRILFDGGSSSAVQFEDPNKRNLAAEVCKKERVVYQKGKRSVVLVDCGTKNNIIQAFLRRDITVIRVPYDYDFLREDVDGVLLSNGPGDPKQCIETIAHTKHALESGIPILGICLGCQILGLAAGADTYKLPYGHRSHNQPVNELGSRRCYITSQNHGYAINSETLPQDWREWFTNDNDGTNEGIVHLHKPYFGAQFHPEASPGPDDTEFIFDLFVRALR